MPAWLGLPTESQEALTDLITGLVLEHADKNQIGAPVMISDKIRSHYVERKSLLYVRQWLTHQVLHNRRESSVSQYAMHDHLMALGCSEIEVIDEDVGRFAAGGVQRAGFERMVAQVCLLKVGAAAAHELSRFGRNSLAELLLEQSCKIFAAKSSTASLKPHLTTFDGSGAFSRSISIELRRVSHRFRSIMAHR